MSDLRERVARAICAADEQNGGPPWEWFIATKHKTGIEQHLERADAAIAIVLEEAARVAMTSCHVSPRPRECEECRGSRLAYRWPDEIAAAIRALKEGK